MNKEKYNILLAREQALVDAQCLLQKALNKTYGNPRDFEETDPKKTDRLFKEQRKQLAACMKVARRTVDAVFSDEAEMSVKDLAGYLHVLGYDLRLELTKRWGPPKKESPSPYFHYHENIKVGVISNVAHGQDGGWIVWNYSNSSWDRVTDSERVVIKDAESAFFAEE